MITPGTILVFLIGWLIGDILNQCNIKVFSWQWFAVAIPVCLLIGFVSVYVLKI